MDCWTARQGGLLTGRCQTRVTLAAKPLIARCTGVGVTVQVLETQQVGAFGWPNGHLFVTRGLVDRLDGAELSAAIAHEMGHLLDGGKLRMIDDDSQASNQADPDREVRADAAGLQLLRADGIPPQAMCSMLRKVERFSALTPSGTLSLDHRLQKLSSQMGA